MSNKKLFWLVFIILSICEFGQFAYSQNTHTPIEQHKIKPAILQCEGEQVDLALYLLELQSTTYLLPR